MNRISAGRAIKRILIQLPGIKDTQRAKELIGKTAQLEFKLVDEENLMSMTARSAAPPGSEWVDPYNKVGQTQTTPDLLKKRTLLTGCQS